MQLYITFSHLLLEDSVRKKIPKLKINGKTVKKVYSFVVTVHWHHVHRKIPTPFSSLCITNSGRENSARLGRLLIVEGILIETAN